MRSGAHVIWKCVRSVHRRFFESALSATAASAICTLPVVGDGLTPPRVQLGNLDSSGKSSQNETSVSTPSGSLASDASVEKQAKKQVFCQAHLVRWDGRTGQLMSGKLRMGHRVPATGLLSVDTLTREGIVLTNENQNIEAALCSRHRQIYADRTDEMKCQNANCFGIGILLEHRGRKYLECQHHFHRRLDGKEMP